MIAQTLRPLLTVLTPADATERRHQERMLALLDGADDAFARSHFVPGHFTASAFVLSPDEASVLLIFHSKLKLWLQPGGHIDPTDGTVIEAARREVAEETGLTGVTQVGAGLFDVDIHGIPPNTKRGEPAHEHFDVRILLRSETFDFQAGSDALAARWVPLEDFGTAALETDDSVQRAIRKIRAAR